LLERELLMKAKVQEEKKGDEVTEEEIGSMIPLA
jgi:hypothetical protein